MRVDAQVTQSDLVWAASVFESEPSFAGSALPEGRCLALERTSASLQVVRRFVDAHVQLDHAERAACRLLPLQLCGGGAGAGGAALFAGVRYHAAGPGAASIPKMTVGGYFVIGFSTNGPQPRMDSKRVRRQLHQGSGGHSLMFGAHLERFAVSNPFFARNRQLRLWRYRILQLGRSAAGLSGGRSGLLRSGLGSDIIARAWEIFTYVQDNWKISRSFTLNYGMGWDSQNAFQNSVRRGGNHLLGSGGAVEGVSRRCPAWSIPAIRAATAVAGRPRSTIISRRAWALTGRRKAALAG